ncbi:hypothetical protein CBM2629_B130099 [Cupriavidus taiwanensis]|nr:hypothetical protein CBM2629_B130099 [Cupriavidus taiwanensis]
MQTFLWRCLKFHSTDGNHVLRKPIAYRGYPLNIIAAGKQSRER